MSENKIKKAQSAFEYLMSYGWAMLIMGIVVAILFYFAGIPGTVTPSTCAFNSNLLCSDINLGINSTGSTTLNFNLTNQLPYALASPTAVVKINNVNTSSVTCTPSSIPSGGSINCQIALSGVYTFGQFISGAVYVTVGNCGLVANYLSTKVCTNPPTQVLSGSFSGRTEAPLIHYIYCVGGSISSSTNNVYYAPVYASGTGGWTYNSPYPVAINAHRCAYSNNYVYCVSGIGGANNVYYSPVLPGGGLGGWTLTSNYPVTNVYSHSCVASSGTIYCIGGVIGGSYSALVYYAPISKTGAGTWTSVAAGYATTVGLLSCDTYSGYIYCVGGYDGGSVLNTVYYAPISSTGIGTWALTSNYPIPIDYESCAAYSGYIYCAGGSDGTLVRSTVYSAPISSTGVGAWTATSSYPITIESESCKINNNFIYCIGGTNGGSVPYSYYSAIVSATGNVVVWKTSANNYPISVQNDQCIIR